ncbi:proline-rich protein 36-like [Mesoplodon densirostris]|uniref:proline-rich protein 36-like n=1 Tax=Mesoplodon densirostris TaxID=48708 RepID=UPI0028DAFD6B|nr:proline-rich protein 36-like [Mesoplodon densirostris]
MPENGEKFWWISTPLPPPLPPPCAPRAASSIPRLSKQFPHNRNVRGTRARSSGGTATVAQDSVFSEGSLGARLGEPPPPPPIPSAQDQQAARAAAAAQVGLSLAQDARPGGVCAANSVQAGEGRTRGEGDATQVVWGSDPDRRNAPGIDDGWGNSGKPFLGNHPSDTPPPRRCNGGAGAKRQRRRRGSPRAAGRGAQATLSPRREDLANTLTHTHSHTQPERALAANRQHGAGAPARARAAAAATRELLSPAEPGPAAGARRIARGCRHLSGGFEPAPAPTRPRAHPSAGPTPRAAGWQQTAREVSERGAASGLRAAGDGKLCCSPRFPGPAPSPIANVATPLSSNPAHLSPPTPPPVAPPRCLDSAPGKTSKRRIAGSLLTPRLGISGNRAERGVPTRPARQPASQVCCNGRRPPELRSCRIWRSELRFLARFRVARPQPFHR